MRVFRAFPDTQPAERTPPAAPAPTKPWWQSRTLWFNAVCAGLAAAEAGAGLLQPLLPVPAYAALAFVLPVGNALLRSATSKAITR